MAHASKNVAVNCGFEKKLDTMIKDKFVTQLKTEAVRKIVSELPKEKNLDEVLAAVIKAQAKHKKEDTEEDTSSSSSEDKSKLYEELIVDNDNAYRPVHAYDCPCEYCNIIRSNMWGPKGYIGLGKPKEKIVYLSKEVKDWK